jgi:hypothetical protein
MSEPIIFPVYKSKWKVAQDNHIKITVMGATGNVIFAAELNVAEDCSAAPSCHTEERD